MINNIKMLNLNIERKFWGLIIPWMRKEPKIVEKIASIGYYFIDRMPKRNFLVQSIFWVCIGLSIGLGIGILLP